jgi:hypothetical protein
MVFAQALEFLLQHEYPKSQGLMERSPFMRIRWTLAVLLLLGFGAWTNAAHACSADFSGNCSWAGGSASAFCVFDASRPNPNNPIGTACPGSTISAYFWDYGDGASGFGSSFVSHTYLNPPSLTAVSVHMSVFCADGCSDTRSRGVCFTIGAGGCIFPNSGWN